MVRDEIIFNFQAFVLPLFFLHNDYNLNRLVEATSPPPHMYVERDLGTGVVLCLMFTTNHLHLIFFVVGWLGRCSPLDVATFYR